MKQTMKLTIEIDNLTKPQALAIEDLLATWVMLGSAGSSRWTAFYADGDGNFRPRVTVDGRKAEVCKLTDAKARWKRVDGVEMYMLDFDSIAWALRDKKEKGGMPGVSKIVKLFDASGNMELHPKLGWVSSVPCPFYCWTRLWWQKVRCQCGAEFVTRDRGLVPREYAEHWREVHGEIMKAVETTGVWVTVNRSDKPCRKVFFDDGDPNPDNWTQWICGACGHGFIKATEGFTCSSCGAIVTRVQREVDKEQTRYIAEIAHERERDGIEFDCGVADILRGKTVVLPKKSDI